jgi:hypothetical protein
VRHHRRVPSDVPPEPTEACPGCGAVLVRPAEPVALHAGASAACARLYEVTLHGLREEAGADPAAAAVVRRADATYGAQHADPADPDRLRVALEVLGVAADERLPPSAWRTTIADVAADLDVIDLHVLVDAWARSVAEDWAAVGTPPR